MKIFDCFMYFDEDIVLDLRFNYLHQFVDQFVIVESRFTHSGKRKDLKFNIENFKEFKDKIKYLVIEDEPKGIEAIFENDNKYHVSRKYILNAAKRENYQRNLIENGLDNANPEDIILISDVDEIPKLENINFKNIKNRLIFFEQKMFYYKFNLCSKSINWIGTKACRMKDLVSPQWLRNIKDKKYPLWRLDVFFSKNKYNSINFIKDGGWHFSYLKDPKGIEKKLKSYLHHLEYEENPIGIDKIEEMIKLKKSVYNLKADMRSSKFNKGQHLTKIEFAELPDYIQNNKEKYKLWLE